MVVADLQQLQQLSACCHGAVDAWDHLGH
jgi:hypothetical protein